MTTARRPIALDTVLRETGLRLLSQIKGHTPGVLAGQDPEDLHQLRVAVRRLRVLMPLTRGLQDAPRRRQLGYALKALAQVLGPARDSDVFVAEIWPPLQVAINDGRWVQARDAEWLAQQRRDHRKLQRALCARRFGVLLSQLESYFAPAGTHDNPARGVGDGMRFAEKVLRRRTRRVYERYRDARLSNDTQDQALHRLRIAIKKLRYELDFLAPLMRTQPARKVRAQLANMQHILGRMNDVATATVRLETAMRRHRGAPAERRRNALSAWRRAQVKRLHQKFNAAWKAWQKVSPYR